MKLIVILPIIMEMYMFSIDSIDEATLDASQIALKEDFSNSRTLFEEKRKVAYLDFVEELSELILA